MVFSSNIFLFLFLPILLILYFNPLVKNRACKNTVLFFGSILFYAWGEPVFVFIMLFSIVVNWVLGLLMERFLRAGFNKTGKGCLLLALVWNLSLLFLYKYLGFVAGNIGLLLHKDATYYGVNLALPIGISFFTFQIMSYVIDVYRQKVSSQKNILYLGMYIMMFPQLIAGPIVRYETIADEIVNRKETLQDFTTGFSRFVFGLGKKVLLANYVGSITDFIWRQDEKSVLLAWIGAVGYTLQIYLDFSGYSDMAIGLGRMFGFHYDENFNFPYISKSITEFWRRWHISLSTWFRDYVYIPLGGNRVSKGRNYFNLFVVWLLTGIWHGADWTFILWGLAYFVLLVIEKAAKVQVKRGVSHVYTMFFVILLWVVFRAEGMEQAVSYLGCMFGIGASGITGPAAREFLSYNWPLWVVSILACMPVVPFLKSKIQSQMARETLQTICMLAVFVLSMMSLVVNEYNPFIYFNF